MIATGGLATLFEKQTDVFDAIEPDLTIQGLAMLWSRAHIAIDALALTGLQAFAELIRKTLNDSQATNCFPARSAARARSA